MIFNVGDRVTKDKVLRTDNPIGTVEKVNKDYVVVKWEGINGHWHYTPEQSKQLEIVNEGG